MGGLKMEGRNENDSHSGPGNHADFGSFHLRKVQSFTRIRMNLLLCLDRTSTMLFMRHWACTTCAGAIEALSDSWPAVARYARRAFRTPAAAPMHTACANGPLSSMAPAVLTRQRFVREREFTDSLALFIQKNST